MLSTSGDIESCEGLCSRIPFAYNAKSIRVDMLPDDHPNKAKWQKDLENFSIVYLEHIDRAKAAGQALVDFDKKHAEEVEEYRRITGSDDVPESIQKDGDVLVKKLRSIRDKDHPEILLQLKSMPNPEIAEKPVEEPKREWSALNDKFVDCVRPCDDECTRIVETYNDFEAQVLSMSNDHPKKPGLINWCKQYDAKLHKHSADWNGLYDKIFVAQGGLPKFRAEGMTRLATGRMTAAEYNEELTTGLAYIVDLKKQIEALGIDGQHEQLRAGFAAGPKID